VAIATSTAILGAAALGAGASLYASNQASRAQSRAAGDAAASQREAAGQSIDAQERMFERQVELQEPFRQSGLTAQNRMMALLGIGEDRTAPDFGKYARDFGMSDFQTDPGYGFRLSEGMKALERSAAARGGLLSGATMKGITRFGQDTASGEYMNAFNRYQTNRSNQLNPLQSLMGSGQTSTNALSSAAQQTGAGMGSTYMGMGQGVANAQMAGGAARASGYTGMANALNSGLSTGANLYMQAPIYNAMAGYYTRGNPVP
jgi:hypothetical protein